jgi:hypothetical protein
MAAIRIVKNQTSNPVIISDLNTTVSASGQADISRFPLEQLAESSDLAIHLGNGNLLLNTGGSEDIVYPSSIDIIRNIPQTFKTTGDNRLIVNSTPQPGTMTDFCLTSRTDSATDTVGDLMHIDHTVFQYGIDTQGINKPCGLFVDNGNTSELSKYWLNTKYLEFDVLGNRTFFYDGGIMWRGLADNNVNGMIAVSLEAVSSVFDPSNYEVVPGTGNATLVDGYLLVPYAGGQYNLPVGRPSSQTPQPFKMTACTPMIMTGTYWAPAFWQVDYNLTEDKFFNLQPCEDLYAERRNTSTEDPNIIRVFGNLFNAEIPLMSFVKDFLVIGNSNSFFSVASPDATEIGHGIRIRMDCKTIVNSAIHPNVAWSLVGYIKTYREHTV